MDEWVQQVDEQDQVSAVVLRSEAVRRGLLHRVAVTLCRDRDGRILVHQRSQQASPFPGHYEVVIGGAVAVGESYEEAAVRELAEELGVQASVRLVGKFLKGSGSIMEYPAEGCNSHADRGVLPRRVAGDAVRRVTGALRGFRVGSAWAGLHGQR